MDRTSTIIRVEGIDAADTIQAAQDLRDIILNHLAEREETEVEVRMKRSDNDTQDASGDILNIFHTGVVTGLLIVESIKLWRETRRDKALIIEAKHGSAVRVEMSDPDAPKSVEKAIITTGNPTKPT